MKLFKKKNQKKTEEEEGIVDGIVNGMPAPPTVPNQDPRNTQRNVNPPKGRQVDPRYSQQELKQDPRYSQQQQDRRYIQQQQDPRYSPQQQQEPPRYSPQQDPRHHQQKEPRYSQQQGHHRQSNQNRPPQQSAQEMDSNVPPPPKQHQQASPHSPPRSSSPQVFEAIQTPPKKEKAPPTAIGIDPVVQAERAAITRELVKQYVAGTFLLLHLRVPFVSCHPLFLSSRIHLDLDVWNRGDLELIPKVCSRGLRFNGSAGMDRVGHDGFARMVQTIRASLEDYHCEIHSMVVEGNKAFCRMRFTGRHVGQLLGYEATGKHVSWMGASEFTVVDGLIVKVWELGDMASLEHQLRQAKAAPPPIGVEGEC